MANDFVAMSKAARRNRINGSKLWECPYCKANIEEAEYGGIEPVENGDAEQTVECLECHRKWVDVFRLKEVRELFSSAPGGGICPR